MDEKLAVSLNQLNLGAKLKAQVAKRIDAPLPTDEALEKHFAAVVAPAPAAVAAKALVSAPAIDNKTFFDTWDAYYPRIVSLLGWASWVIPGPALKVIKSMLAVVNSSVIPLLRELLANK